MSVSSLGRLVRGIGRGQADGRPRSRRDYQLIAVYGAGLMAAGVFRADPADGFGPGAPLGKAVHVSWHGDGHLVAASIGFIALIAACFAIARSFSRAGQRGLAIYSRVTGIAFLAVFAWIAVVSVHHYRNV